ncbi:MAG: STAS domain-containing protein [Spirochaetes bacterium]|nr:STAS domain-containing protein [Spirochaetota bacterium]
MKIDIYKEEGLVILTLIGRLDINQVHNLEMVFYKQIEKNPSTIAFNLKDCTYIDSAAIVSFVRFKNITRKNKIDLICYNLNENIERIFKIAKMGKFLTILTEKEFFKRYVKSS